MNVLIPIEHFEAYSVGDALHVLNDLGFDLNCLGGMAMHLIQVYQNYPASGLDAGQVTEYLNQKFNITNRINSMYDLWFGSALRHMAMLNSISDVILEIVVHVLMIYRDLQTALIRHHLPYLNTNFININENGVILNVVK